jgi:serine/threonine protein kinase
MHTDQPSDGPRPGTARVPTPPVLQPRSESERRRLAELVPATDDAKTVISSRHVGQVAHAPTFNGEFRGRRLAHFELVEPIGAGGMAAVIKATDLTLGRAVALKILPPQTAADAEHVTRFQSEARAAAKLDHENVARVYFCGEDQGVYFIAFEFVEGENLRTIIDRRGTLPVAETVRYMLQVAAGLAHAAERGVVHRDVKPSNIIITPAGRAKLVDMGLARHRDAAADGLTRSGVTLGTFDYISPEQALEPRSADVRSDIYSLGCTFYHALTGVPPVPEGTAAKKLDAHQHVPPPDPRRFNPAIPDDVVAVLGRMMAKDPRDRYQRPEDLVHDLLVIARRTMGAGSLAPSTGTTDEGLWVDAPLPANPRRTGLWAAAAVLAVVLLVAVIEAGRPTPPVSGVNVARLVAPPTETDSADTKTPAANVPVTERDGPSTPKNSPPPHAVLTVHEVADADQLRELFRQDVHELHVRLTGTEPYVLNDAEGEGDPAGLSFAGKRLVLEAADPASPAVIRFKAAPAGDGKSAAALAVTGKDGAAVTATVRGVRFEIDGGPEVPAAAIAARDVDKLDVDRCSFVMPDQPVGARPAGAVVVQGRAPDRSTVALKDCLFVRGTQAVQLLGRANVYAQHCCFGPHAGGVIHLRDTDAADGGGTLVRLEHCSALLDGGAVVWAEDGAGGAIQVGHCLFSSPAPTAPAPRGARDDEAGAVLVRQTGAAAGVLTYQGLLGLDGNSERNGYHNLAALWCDETSPAAPRRATTLEDARALSSAGRDDVRRTAEFRDDGGMELAQSPWADPAPLARLADAAKTNAPPGAARDAFAVNLRLSRLRLSRPQFGVLGALRNVWGPSYPTTPPPDAEPPVVRAKVVNPAAPRMDAERGIYTSLAHAVLDARPGDTILIQKTGPLEVEPLRLERPDLRLTIKAFPRYRPVLMLPPPVEPDAALFGVLDGELRLEGLDFALRPGRSACRSQAVVSMAGGGACSFVNCVLTLEEIEGVSLSAVLVPEVSAARPGTGSFPRLRFETCFIRGKGDLLTARAGRRFEIDLDGTLAALDGSLVSAGGAAREPAAGPAQVRLRRSTAVLTESVLDLRSGRDEDARRGSTPPPVALACENSLLAAANGRALVRVDGVDSDDQVRQLLTWTSRQTVYVNTGSALVEVVPANPERMPQPTPFDADKWLAFTREADPAATLVRLRFANPPGTDRPWARSRPADLRTKPADPSRAGVAADIGAPLDSLPAPGE